MIDIDQNWKSLDISFRGSVNMTSLKITAERHWSNNLGNWEMGIGNWESGQFRNSGFMFSVFLSFPRRK